MCEGVTHGRNPPPPLAVGGGRWAVGEDGGLQPTLAAPFALALSPVQA